MEFDATGRMKEPDFDMTLEQFEKAVREIDTEFTNAKAEAEAEINKYYNKLGLNIDVEQFVELEETIPVRVLYPQGNTEQRHLEIYTLNIPELKGLSKIWVWHGEAGENTCDECAGLDNQIFYSEDEIPECQVHPNCKCWVEEIELDEEGNPIKSSKYNSPIKQDATETKSAKDMNFSNNGIQLLKDKEDTVKDGDKHVVYDDRTGKPVPDGVALPAGATIGYGHLLKESERFEGGITEAQAIQLLRDDMQIAEKTVRDNIEVQLTQNQFDALVLLTYNIGAGAFKDSTIKEYINNPEYRSNVYPTAESAWKAWNRTQGQVSRGLINRRNEEWNLFENGIY